MNTQPIAKIIRIIGVHFAEAQMLNKLNDIEKKLKEMKLERTEESADNFLISYSNPEYTNQNRSTLIFFDSNDNVIDLKFTALTSE